MVNQFLARLRTRLEPPLTRDLFGSASRARNPIRGATPACDYQIGDQAFFPFAGIAGEGLCIANSGTMPNFLVLALSQDPGFVLPAAYCSPTRHMEPQLGHRYRKKYLEQLPTKLLGSV